MREIPSLDGLRALSISLVILSHSFGPVPGHGFLFNLLLKHGGLGVRIFFIISGYLITALCIQEREQAGSLSLKLFYIRRALRILPAFYLYAGIMLVLGLSGRLPIPAHNWIYVFTWTMNYNPDRQWFVSHLWSLSVEEQFYLAWPLALKFLKPAGWIAIAVIAVFAGVLLRGFQTLSGVVLIDPATLPFAFPLVAGPIAMGSLLAIHQSRVSSWVRGWRPAWVALGAAAALVFETAAEMREGGFRPSAELIVDAVMTLLIAWCVFRPQTAFGRLLNAPAAIHVGTLSYSLYLWQEAWVWGFDRPLYVLPLAWIAIYFCARMSFNTVERPLRELRRQYRPSSRDTLIKVAAVRQRNLNEIPSEIGSGAPPDAGDNRRLER
jgi:peptidoglycan/LPS O-acetylase OafA/YrhL